MLSHTLSLLPEIIYGGQGKPAFAPETPLWLNLGHSGDDVVLLLGNKGEAGYDIEVVCPRANWHWLVSAVFSLGEHAEMGAVRPDQRLEVFWRTWARKETIAKQRDDNAWQIVGIDSAYNSSLSISRCQLKNLSLVICALTPLTLTTDNIQRIGSVN